jgi:hypothetical protein
MNRHPFAEAPKLRQKWEIYDSRNGRKATGTIYPSREWARWQIQAWRELGTGNMHHVKAILHFLDTRPAAKESDDR